MEPSVAIYSSLLAEQNRIAGWERDEAGPGPALGCDYPRGPFMCGSSGRSENDGIAAWSKERPARLRRNWGMCPTLVRTHPPVPGQPVHASLTS